MVDFRDLSTMHERAAVCVIENSTIPSDKFLHTICSIWAIFTFLPGIQLGQPQSCYSSFLLSAKSLWFHCGSRRGFVQTLLAPLVLKFPCLLWPKLSTQFPPFFLCTVGPWFPFSSWAYETGGISFQVNIHLEMLFPSVLLLGLATKIYLYQCISKQATLWYTLCCKLISVILIL